MNMTLQIEDANNLVEQIKASTSIRKKADLLELAVYEHTLAGRYRAGRLVAILSDTWVMATAEEKRVLKARAPKAFRWFDTVGRWPNSET